MVERKGERENKMMEHGNNLVLRQRIADNFPEMMKNVNPITEGKNDMLV